MKRTVLATAILLAASSIFAQTDTTKKVVDTLQVGNFIIIKKVKKSMEIKIGTNNHDSTYSSNRKKRNISTNWWIVDLGFANMRDETNYAFAQAGPYFKILRPADGAVSANNMKLNRGKSSNINIWLFMQKLNITKHVLNLKYGLGLEMFNLLY